ncbi:ABC transporter integral membrane type 1 [Penicillium citrinum]|uniref:ABC transporter integral membrane type 1 n=1 Tax=Penicillium citrinum TaxID=5077 RepID=A0A9W9NLG6_PENCI|nr:ABC transporter integral membrane type 1 [Penicillium citrinum]KAJ5222196.1 ABC transporter integral membrane type 1 [Penicillium citrinum]
MVIESTGKRSSLVATTEKPATPEPFGGFWKRASFAWLAGTFRQGYVKILSVHDLPDLDPQLNSQIVAEKLHRSWAQVATFVVYIIIALVRHDNSILATQTFTSLSLISLVTTPILTFIQALLAVIQYLDCLNRIQEYASVPGLYDDENIHKETIKGKYDDSVILQAIPKSVTEEKELVKFSNYSVGWKQDAPPVLREIQLNIPHGAITMIVGPIDMSRNLSLTAYCSQTPWLQSETIRQNIIGVSVIDMDWYTTVVSACGFEKDLAQLPRGDQTPVGNNGLTLSGGQKQRIALARALYSRCKIVLLDNVFSSIDAAATEAITRNVFGKRGLFRQLQTTVVLAIYSTFLLQYADNIVVLAHGYIVDTGSLETLQVSNTYIQGVKIASPTPSITIDSNKMPFTPYVSDTQTWNNELETELLDHESLTDHIRQNGDFSVYAYYASASGLIWLDWWTAANAKSPNSGIGMYLGIYVMLGIVELIFMIAACWCAIHHMDASDGKLIRAIYRLIFVHIVSESALRLHNDLANSTKRAPFQFFHRVDIGSITNRFTQDMDLINMRLPLEALNFLAAPFAKYLGIAIPFMGIFVYVAQKFYLRTSRQMRRLDIEAKAPLYTHFLELVSGAATVRAFRWHEAFNAKLFFMLNISQRPVYILYCIQQCLGFFLDLLVAVLAVILMATVIFLHHNTE